MLFHTQEFISASMHIGISKITSTSVLGTFADGNFTLLGIDINNTQTFQRLPISDRLTSLVQRANLNSLVFRSGQSPTGGRHRQMQIREQVSILSWVQFPNHRRFFAIPASAICNQDRAQLYLTIRHRIGYRAGFGMHRNRSTHT